MVVVLEGYVKRRRDNISWVLSERYLILDGNGTLLMFKRRGDPVARRTIILNNSCSVSDVYPAKDGDVQMFTLTFHRDKSTLGFKKEIIEFGTASVSESLKWKNNIETAIHRSDNMSRNGSSEAQVGDTPASIAAILQPAGRRGLLQTLNVSNRRFRKHASDAASSSAFSDAADDVSSTAVEEDDMGGEEDEESAVGWRVVSVEGGVSVMQELPQNDEEFSHEVLQSCQKHNNLIQRTTYAILATSLVILVPRGSWRVIVYFAMLAVVVGTVLQNRRKSKFAKTSTKVSHVIHGYPDEIFDLLQDTSKLRRWDSAFASLKTIETVDAHTDIVYGVLKPVWTWPIYHRPRDVVFTRYWRKERDGSYLIILQSTSHPQCPPTKTYVRSTILAGAYVIAPLRPAFENGVGQSLLTIVMKYEASGQSHFWETMLGSSTFYCKPLLLNAVSIGEEIARHHFISPQISDAIKVSGVSVDHSGVILGVEKLPGSTTEKYWAEPSAESFKVRGADYITDKKKVSSAPSLFHLVGFEVLSFEDPKQRYNICARDDNIINQQAHTSTSFYFCVNFVVPCSDNLCLALYYKPTTPHWKEERSPTWELFQDFIDADDDFRNSRFKLIPTVVDGSFIYKSAVGNSPVIMGNKGLHVPYHKGEHYFEIDIDIDSDRIARQVVGMCLGATKALVVDLAFLIEGKSHEELPENVLGTVRIKNIDMKKAMKRVPA